MKTHKASAKRFRVTGSGKIMRRRAGKQQSDSNWFLDPGATSHMTNDLSNLSFYQPYQGHDQVAIGDGTTLPIVHTSNVLLPTPFPFRLTNMLHVPTLSSNLLSVHHLAVDNNCTITFDEDSFLVQDKNTREC
ncbi:unnamed protein product [Camellia sinensis]